MQACSSPGTRSIRAALGWADGNAAAFASRSARSRSPTVASISGSVSPTGGRARCYHWLDDALVFVVYPGEDRRGVVRFEGTWMLEENSDSR